MVKNLLGYNVLNVFTVLKMVQVPTYFFIIGIYICPKYSTLAIYSNPNKIYFYNISKMERK